MSVIYEPKGKAREYCDLAVNLYRGCNHGCTYCYAPSVLRLSRQDFAKSQPRKDILKSIEKEAPGYKDKEILLCFTCDPYQGFENGKSVTREAIEILLNNKLHVNILTKAGLKSTKDFDLLSRNGSKYGTTLTFTSEKDSLEYEPQAALPAERIEALKQAKEIGIKTWASLEPVIRPKQTLELIELTKDCVDMYKVGKWNHDQNAKEIDWCKFAKEVIGLLKKYKKKYYVKEDLAKYLQKNI